MIVICPQCGAEHKPGTARFCSICGAKLPEQAVRVPDRLRIDYRIKPRYTSLEFTAGWQIFLGWVTIIVAIIAGLFIYTTGNQIADDIYSATTYVNDGYSKITGEYVERDRYRTFPTLLSLAVTLGGIMSGLRLIAAGQKTYLLIHISDEASVATREMLRFYKWYAEKERKQ